MDFGKMQPKFREFFVHLQKSYNSGRFESSNISKICWLRVAKKASMHCRADYFFFFAFNIVFATKFCSSITLCIYRNIFEILTTTASILIGGIFLFVWAQSWIAYAGNQFREHISSRGFLISYCLYHITVLHEIKSIYISHKNKYYLPCWILQLNL